MIEIVTGAEVNEATGKLEEVYDTFDGPEVTWVTEPSGVLVVMERPGKLWVAYAPGSWQKVRSV
ncbi:MULTISPECIES: hypothetical protein [Gordonia]|uniref:Uncharacterized protein n=1 Tax=Gordonia sihwensis NBRC 108236 TaxID=1223544 RepID=L7LHQ9_9ACTN|nr:MULTISPECIES: hypothetical protein [Gordonia]AUH68519.1 hypothetical protein CXX93_09340 [Gordonia sp. YC-JH1]KXT55648.1 hypothetical protein Y710_18205 [Gordonia sp. QH-12]GAC60650.1 hypothetical protein GSI01S_10_02450 [Gordonia sihwensis NBRC 108236]